MSNFLEISFEVWVPRGNGGYGMIGSFNDWHDAEAWARKESKFSGKALSKMKIKEVHMVRKEVGEWTP